MSDLLIRSITLGTTLLLAACNSSESLVIAKSDLQAEQFFAEHVQPSLGYCRTCHVPGGVADVDEGRQLMLTSNETEDYGRMSQAWDVLGRGVDTNPILQRASGADSSHSGGAPWPPDSEEYMQARKLLACWDDDAACDSLN